MLFILHGFILSTLLLTGVLTAPTNTSDNLVVQARTGTFIGNINDTYTDVRQFKYVPYAKPPVGDRRWAPPSPLDTSDDTIESSVFGPVCPQYVSKIPTAWALNITGNLVENYGESLLAGYAAQNSAEDCLSLAIWTPLSATRESELPVVIFTSGGGDVTGGIDIPTQLPANFVHRSQRHIVVTINYRVNIFGTPNARGLKNVTNLAVLDQRMAVEWVSENIANFGGDPSRITLWGQSAGAGLTDMYLFAWYDNPIIAASVSSTGVAIGESSHGIAVNGDVQGTNFTFVAKSLGCDFEDADLELQCMRRIPATRIENFIGQYQDNSTLVNPSQTPLSFSMIPDGKLIFTNYTERYVEGKVARVPKILGTTAREAAPLVPYPINDVTAGPNETLVYDSTLATVCGVHAAAVARTESDLPTWRYQWAGNFSNIAPLWWLGAYHYSDLYMFFGTYLIAPGAITELETNTSATMQDFLLDFITDPLSLPSSGWPAYLPNDTDGGVVARFGADGQAVQYVSGDDVEGPCYLANATLNMSP
ncbi:Alpha/Beta hydrolase protein [Xylariales sp. PMI_506]|nr:Alpha/Beta hydrolase protein [Xylariales sp. PMI_506]